VTEPGQVVLKIANLLGQEITTLVAEEKAAGSYKVVWDGRDRLGRRMASGVYLYRIEAQGIALTSKMLLLQ
jgi:flagellar hook assembly protein FlgD